MSKPSPLTTDLSDIDLEPEDFTSSVPIKKVPYGDIFEAARAGDVDRLGYLIESGININARDKWDSVPLYYACLVGHFDAARMLLENGAICSEYTFDGDRCHYAALNLKVRKLLKNYEARPPALGPLQAALRETFLGCQANRTYLEQSDTQSQFSGTSTQDQAGSSYGHFPPDITFYVQGRPIEAHRAILSARSPFFKMKFEYEWKDRTEVRFSKEKLSYAALYSLIHFFYSDRLEVAVDDLEDLVRICKVCKCEALQRVLEKEMVHHKFADYKALADIDGSQKRFILQGSSLPEEDRLSACLHRIIQRSIAKSEQSVDNNGHDLAAPVGRLDIKDYTDDLADICIRVDKMNFRCHQVVLASRSEYFKTRMFRLKDFNEGENGRSDDSLPCLVEHDLSKEVLEKMIEYMYTDGLEDIDPDQAEEMFDAASRYLLFPLKRAVADVLLPHLEMVSPAELCHWLLLSDIYGVVKIREYCLDTVACNFETFADSPEFRAMLLTLPPPSGDSSLRTTAPNAPGAVATADQGNLLDDLREKWLEIEAGELDKRDESALLFDKRLEVLMLMAEHERSISDDKT